MSKARPRVVYDCNIYVQALLNINGPGGSCVRRALNNEVALFLSEPIPEEIRNTPNKATPARLGVTSARTERLIENLLKVATLLLDVDEAFSYPRDPDDAHYINVALTAEAKLVVSRDKDLLALMSNTSKDGKDFQVRYPQLRILDPVQFIRELEETQTQQRPER